MDFGVAVKEGDVWSDLSTPHLGVALRRWHELVEIHGRENVMLFYRARPQQLAPPFEECVTRHNQTGKALGGRVQGGSSPLESHPRGMAGGSQG